MLQLKDIKKITFKGKEYKDINVSSFGNLVLNPGKRSEKFFSTIEPHYVTANYNVVDYKPKDLKITL